MSEHTQGKLIAKYEWLVPEAHQYRPIGNSSNPIHDRDNYAQVVAQVRGRYHDQDANARRLAAAWNAFDGVRTEFIEAMAGTGAMQAASDSMSALPAAQAELNAARALLREALDTIEEFPDEDHEIADRIKGYLDACDKPGAPDAS